MVELRKRKEHPVAAAPAVKRATKARPEKKAAESWKPGDHITVAGFGGQVELHDMTKTSLEQLLETSKSGVVLFTYPKASTPGCEKCMTPHDGTDRIGTTQACLFRDAYTPLTDAGLSVFGLSRDSVKANTSFKNKQNLQYSLICDPSAELIGAIGLKNGDRTQRGVFVVNKDGRVLVSTPGGPAATLEAVRAILPELKG